MADITNENLEVLARYLRGFPLKKEAGINLEQLYTGGFNHRYSTLFRGIQSDKPIDEILDQAKYDNWTSWTTDINTAIYFAKTCKRARQEIPYLLITFDKDGIDVGAAIRFVKSEKSLQDNSLTRCSDHEHEVILQGPILGIYIMEIPSIHNIQ